MNRWIASVLIALPVASLVAGALFFVLSFALTNEDIADGTYRQVKLFSAGMFTLILVSVAVGISRMFRWLRSR